MRFFQSVMIWAALGVMFSANAEAPHVFTYNGRLEKDGVLVTGEVQMRVSLSSSVDPVEEPFWSQEYPVSVQNGAFSILVGEPVQGQPENPLLVDPFANDGSVYIGVEVGEEVGEAAEGGQGGQGGAINWVFIGRKKLTASPYAITADYASRSKGMTIESDSRISFDNDDAPLKITDGDGNTLKMDGNKIQSSTGTLQIPGTIRSGTLVAQQINKGINPVISTADILISEEFRISSGAPRADLGDSRDRFCFLSSSFWAASSGSCRVRIDENRELDRNSWYLSASNNGVPNVIVQCYAYCVQFR